MKKKRLQRSDTLWLAAVAMLIVLQFWWLPGNPGTPDDTYSTAIEGKRGFFQTLQSLSEAGLLAPVSRETDQLIPDQTCTLVVISPDRYPDEREQRELAQFVARGGTLVFAPNWSDTDCSIPQLRISTVHEYLAEEDTPAPAGRSQPVPAESPTTGNDNPAELKAEAEEGEADRITTENSRVAQNSEEKKDPEQQTSEIEEQVRQRTTVPSAGPDLDRRGFDDIARISAHSRLVTGGVVWRTRAAMSTAGITPDVLVLSAAGTTQAASWPHGRGLVVLSASPDVFSNGSMLDPVRAELAVRLVEHAHEHHANTSAAGGTPPIIVSEYLNSSDKYQGTAVLVSPSLRSGTLQLILVAVLAGWFGFHRFGPARRVESYQRRSLTESATAVGNLHFRTDSGSEAVRSYLGYMSAQLQKKFGTAVRLENSAAIAARSGLDAEDVEKAINNAIGISETKGSSTHAAGAAIRQLSEILSRLSGTPGEVRH